MMNIYIFNQFTLIDICVSYTSLKLTRYFRGIGSFELELNSLEEAKKFEIGNYITLNTDTYIVENIHKYKSADKTVKVEISGKHLNSILDRRVVRSYVIGTETSYESASEDLVDSNFINATDTNRNISNMAVKVSEKATYPTTAISLEKLSVASMLNKSLSYQQLGYKLSLDTENKRYLFEVLQPSDKRDEVYFSELFGNISECDYYRNVSDEKNVCYVFTETETTEIGSAVGLERKEMFVENQYNSELQSNTALESASVVLLQTDMYTYRKDYDVGTIVTFIDKELNISTSKQINSITEYYSNVDEIEIEIGDFIPTIFDKLKGVK